MKISYTELIKRMEDRYEGNVEELLEILSISVLDIVESFYDRIQTYLEDLDINTTEVEE